jgi:uncharacterized protein YutE (UPF0331/DUF86 family)
MTPAEVNKDVISQRKLWIRRMIASLRSLPLQDKAEFLRDPHTVAAAESYLRRALEALFDVGRHILAKKYAFPAAEYKEIAEILFEKKILGKKEKDLLRIMAGYRNRMVHFYHEITPEELYDICRHQLDDITTLLDAILNRLKHQRK